MKKILALILSLFLLSVIGCATTSQEASEAELSAKEAEEVAETGPADYDLSGTWLRTNVSKGCGRTTKEKSTIEITQDGNSVAFTDDKGLTWNSKASGHILPIAGGPIPGNVTVDDYKLKVSADASTITGKLNWEYSGEIDCDGYTKSTYVRK